MNYDLRNDIGEIIITPEEIKEKIIELGSHISQDYQGMDLVLVSVLKGAVIFLSDLLRNITIPVTIDFMAISSYGRGGRGPTGVVRIVKDLDEEITGRHIIVVEDIIDTGLTLSYLLRTLDARSPKSLKVCTFLDRSVRRIVNLPIAYRGFDVPDKFVVGYGLDYKQRYRNLPYVGVLKQEILEGLS